jgi:hypothetical protein
MILLGFQKEMGFALCTQIPKGMEFGMPTENELMTKNWIINV